MRASSLCAGCLRPSPPPRRVDPLKLESQETVVFVYLRDPCAIVLFFKDNTRTRRSRRFTKHSTSPVLQRGATARQPDAEEVGSLVHGEGQQATNLLPDGAFILLF